jgi:hypothetical protein
MYTFNYYPADIKKSIPIGMIDVNQFLKSIESPKPEIIKIFELIRQAEIEGDETTKSSLKQSLYSFTPCVLINQGMTRKYENIHSFTGLMMLDFDHLDKQYAKEFKEFLFNEYPFIIATWLSASGKGVRALVNIPQVSSIGEFKSLFMGLAYNEMAQYNGFDFAPKNCVLPLFMSYDPDLIKGDTTELWDTHYKEPVKPKTEQYKYDTNPSKVNQIVESAIGKITSNGHPQLRATSFALGGYVGAGYIDSESATDLIYSLIDLNDYLSKKPDVYKKTAKTMIDKGINSPLHL